MYSTIKKNYICGRVGHGTLVRDTSDVDEVNGKFLFIPQADMEEFFNDQMTGSIYLRYFCIPYFKNHDLEFCKKVVANPELLPGSKIFEETKWLTREICGQPHT